MNVEFFRQLCLRVFGRSLLVGQVFAVIVLVLGGGLLFYFYWDSFGGQYGQVMVQEDDGAWIGFSTPHLTLGNDSVIMLSSYDEPVVRLSSYNTYGEADIVFYNADADTLLQFLVYDESDERDVPKVDVTSLNVVATEKHFFGSGGDAGKVVLPIEDAGILLARVVAQSQDEKETITKDFVVVRSHFGVLAKEAEQELVFWGQSFDDMRSITGGSVRVYNVENTPTLLETQPFSDEGIARTVLTGKADVALASYNDATSVLLLNLEHLSHGWSEYRRFQELEMDEEMFVFTDRPLYRPGDTIYFKAILRNDTDAQYSIPKGQAELALWSRRSSQAEPLDKKILPISSQGSIDGQFVLPEDAPTGKQYRVVVKTVPTDASSGTAATFQVEHFRKPEYGIGVTVDKSEFVAGEKASFTVSGSYFSGQPLSEKTVTYSVYATNFYNYGYYSSQARVLSDDYRYGSWRQEKVQEGVITLDAFGRARIEVDTAKGGSVLRDKVFSVEVVYTGDDGNPSFARKNVLVYRGAYGIFQDDSDRTYTGSVSAGAQYQLPIILVSRNGRSVHNVRLSATLQRTQWVRVQSSGDHYPDYKKETETLSPVNITTDDAGKALLSFVPQKAGSYDITIAGEDAAGNKIAKEFYLWVRDEGNSFYSDDDDGDGVTLTLRADKQEYRPDETATLFISSTIPDRDVFVSFERGYMHRFEVVRIDGSLATVPIPFQESDMPNIFAKVSGFSQKGYDSVSKNMPVSAAGKQLVVTIETDREVYGPGETVAATVRTTDVNGLPVSAETAVWAVDKALFELVKEKPHDIFETFWSERWNGTQEAHSLRGLAIHGAEMGGGCFAENTAILMAGNTTKPIQEVAVGDIVLTKKNAYSNELVQAKVTAKQKHTVSGYLIINGSMRITPVHILYVNGAWTEAGNIQVGDLLVNQGGESVPVTSVEWQLGDFSVYNLEIEQYHTFIADGIWVHNDKGGGSGPRSVFEDTAYWNPRVRTNASGLAYVRFVLPDNLTTWVVSSVAATTDTRVGNTRDEITVTKDVIVRPILPNVLREGDAVVLSALVQNFTDTDHAFTTALRFDAGDVQAVQAGNKAIDSNDTAIVSWDIHPEVPTSEAVLTFSTQATDDATAADTIIQKIPVRALGFVDTRVETGIDAEEYALDLAERSNADQTNITVSLAPSVLGTLPVAMKYLVDYPYGCVEQTTSRLVPSIIARSEPVLFAEALAGKDIEGIIKKGLKRLRQLQNDDGGWGWWYGSTDVFVTAYVVEYLVVAQELGFTSGSDMLSKAQGFFERKVRGGSDTLRKRNPEIYIPTMYALGLLGSDNASTISLTNISVTPDLLAMAVMTNYLLGNKDADTNGLRQLMDQAKQQGSYVYWEAGTRDRFGSKDASTALALRALVASGTHHGMMVDAVQYLATHRERGYWSNTFGTAQSMRAIAEYSRFAKESDTDYTYAVSLDGKEIARGRVADFKQKIADISIPGDAVRQRGSRLAITKDGVGKLYSTLVVEEFRTDLENAQESSGLSISRSYRNETRPNKPFRVGDTVKVTLVVKGFEDGQRYAVIEDELPSGLIPINESFKNEQYDDNDSNRWWYGREVTENGMVLTLRWVAKKSVSYEYRARVVSEGRFMVPPATVEMMYDPAVSARSSFYEFKTDAFLNR